MSERLNGTHELNMSLMMVLFEQLYDALSEFSSHTPEQRYLLLLDCYSRITEITSYIDIASYLNISRRQLQRIQESLFRPLSKDVNIIQIDNYDVEREKIQD